MTPGTAKSSFLFALAASVAVHATFMAALGRYPIGTVPAWARAGSDAARRGEMVAVLVPDPLDGPNAVKLAEPPPPAPTPAEVQPPAQNEPTPPPPPPKPPELNEFQVGEAKGTGYALHEVPGEQIPLAPKAENDQARLSRDPVGEFGRDLTSSPKAGGAQRPPEVETAAGIGPAAPPTPQSPALVLVSPPPLAQPVFEPPKPIDPEFKTKPPSEAPQSALVAPPPAAVPVAKSDEGETELPALQVRPERSRRVPTTLPTTIPARPPAPSPREAITRQPEAGPTPRAERPKPVETPRPPERRQVAVVVPRVPPSYSPAPRAAVGEGAGGGFERAAGDPLPPSDSDSDAFSQFAGSAVLRQGRLEVQFGRKVKSRRPRFNTGGVVDLIYDQHGIDVVLAVATDATGKVTSVKVSKSSGSNAIDQPIVVSMYDWWFEPPKDKDGKPRPDHFKFTIGLR
jgi:TonB family protein